MRPEKNKKQAKKNKNVKATLSTTEEKVAEHHRICLLRSFPAKRSKTSSPAELLRKGLVNNIKPYVVYLFIHFFLLFFFYEHTRWCPFYWTYRQCSRWGRTGGASQSHMLPFPEAVNELWLIVSSVPLSVKKQVLEKSKTKGVNLNLTLTLCSTLHDHKANSLKQLLFCYGLGHYITLGYKSENKNITQLWRLQQSCMCILRKQFARGWGSVLGFHPFS